MMHKSLWKVLTIVALFLAAATPASALSPAAVGWGNLIVPGLGATLRGLPLRGLTEATVEIGSYYGGTFYAREGAYTIDGSVLVPSGKNISKPLIGHGLQEFGLKLHMFDTFYNYQQVSLAPENADLEKRYQQPLYEGSWSDVLTAPFKWKNLSEPWTYIPTLLVSGLLVYQYRHEEIVQQSYQSSAGENGLYALVEGFGVPMGSAFGEDVLYRGFLQREFRLYTDSIPLSIAMQTVLFTFSHQPKLRPGAAAGGIYFGLSANHFNGNLEPAIAAHFWIDFISGILDYFSFRKIGGRSVPFSVNFQVPF